ncbi:hypothetical protein [Bradyrhizobium sp. RDT46]|jgi:hypothetical protein
MKNVAFWAIAEVAASLHEVRISNHGGQDLLASFSRALIAGAINHVA